MLSGSEASVLPAFFKIERLPQSPAATAPSKREITDSSASPQNDGRMPSPGGRWLAEGQTDEGALEGRKRRIFYPTHPHPSFASQMPPSPCEGEGLLADEDIGPYASVAAVLQGRRSAARRPGAVSRPRVMLSGSEASVFPVLLRHGRTPSVRFADSSLQEGANGFFGFASERREGRQDCGRMSSSSTPSPERDLARRGRRAPQMERPHNRAPPPQRKEVRHVFTSGTVGGGPLSGRHRHL